MSRLTSRSLLIFALLLCALVAAGASQWPPVARGQEQAPLPSAPVANASTPAPSATPGPTAAAPATVTVRLDPYNDASVVSGGQWTPDTNLGGWTSLAVGEQQAGTYRAYLRFVLAGLPPGLQIDSAQLFLTPTETGSQPVNIVANVVQDDWNEASITWNQQPLSTWQAGAATWQPGQAGPFAIDLTAAARTWYACGGTSNDGIVLSADLAGDWVVFDSRKTAYPPVLQITYEASNAPLDCTAAPTSTGSQAPSQPGPSSAGAQIGAVVLPTPLPGTINPGTNPCPTVFCVSRGSDITSTSSAPSTPTTGFTTGSGSPSTAATSPSSTSSTGGTKSTGGSTGNSATATASGG